jgi:hypothetical protein
VAGQLVEAGEQALIAGHRERQLLVGGGLAARLALGENAVAVGGAHRSMVAP